MFNYLFAFSSLAGLSLISILFFQPRWILSLISSIVPGAVYFTKTDKPIIALTIDDGPDAVATPKILEILQQYQARATFFMISDRVKENESVIREVVNQGHELANHLTEDKLSIQLSPEEFETELLEADRIIANFAKPRWLRPGGGWYNTTMVKIARQNGYRVALGSIFPFDTHIPLSWFASTQILCNARPGSIIILHDSGLWGERTALTLSRVLPKLSQKGYQVVTLSELYARNL
ncbi:chitin deacetylase family protein [Microcystis aeruginosa]|uniref:Polysaccharide deacetylase n=1 Tax=Microcystis aeruginosa PCC 9808 TaxID=1160284 RepID=I4HYX3_MICAE|nr:chitin deacetylase family protein [Microcystis aeruginosa]CCI27247.1 Polysaccharide deacetylase [Microcystis aeruginosa PCC 9808]